MKRTQTSKNINSSFNINPLERINRNIIYPNLIDPFVLNISDMAPTVEIIEINSDESEKQHPQNNTNSWCYINSEIEDNYSINRKPREKRHEQDYTYHRNIKVEDEDLNETFNSHCGRDYDRDEIIYYNQVKSLTIQNNNICDTSSDSDLYDDIKIIHFNDTVRDQNCNSYTITECDDNFMKPAEWIHSFKNVKYSPENNYELSNTNSDSTSCSTVKDDDELTKNRNTFSTPIFNWIPKLNLHSSLLPTVAELTEPNKQSSSDITEISANYRFFKKSMNSWLEEKSHRGQQSLEETTVNNSSKLSTLSQMERRRSKVANILNKQIEDKEERSVYCESERNSRSSVKKIEKKVTATNRSNFTAPASTVDLINDKEDAIDATNNLSFSNLQKANIKSNAQLILGTKSNPGQIQKLEGNWIDTDNELIDVYDYDLDTIESSDVQNVSNEGYSDCVPNSILKRAIFQNKPLSNNVPSLHLSFETDFDKDKKSCIQRFFKFINCCK